MIFSKMASVEPTKYKIQDLISENKPIIVSGLLSVAFGSVIYSIRKHVGGTRDFGMGKLMKHKIFQNNPQYASYIWATRAFIYSTSIVGIFSVAIGFGMFRMLEVDNLRDFNIQLKSLLHQKFPSVRVEVDVVEEELAMQEWEREFGQQENYKDPKGSKYITEKIRSKLGNLVTK